MVSICDNSEKFVTNHRVFTSGPAADNWVSSTWISLAEVVVLVVKSCLDAVSFVLTVLQWSVTTESWFACFNFAANILFSIAKEESCKNVMVFIRTSDRIVLKRNQFTLRFKLDTLLFWCCNHIYFPFYLSHSFFRNIFY